MISEISDVWLTLSSTSMSSGVAWNGLEIWDCTLLFCLPFSYIHLGKPSASFQLLPECMMAVCTGRALPSWVGVIRLSYKVPSGTLSLSVGRNTLGRPSTGPMWCTKASHLVEVTVKGLIRSQGMHWGSLARWSMIRRPSAFRRSHMVCWVSGQPKLTYIS